MIMLYCPCPSKAVAQQLAIDLLNKHLIGCANILPMMASIYWWEGQITEEIEVVLLAKTLIARQDAVRQAVEAAHPYTVPCIAFLPLEGVNEAYQNFVRRSLA
ncbi:MAG: divalent-cation tolerance protein CutA [Holosporales bacterium]|jgi:periplasmic divalent cation tolerance protein